MQGNIQQGNSLRLGQRSTREENVRHSVKMLKADAVIHNETSSIELVVNPVLERIEYPFGILSGIEDEVLSPILNPCNIKALWTVANLLSYIIKIFGAENNQIRKSIFTSRNCVFKQSRPHYVIGVKEIQPVARGNLKTRVPSKSFPRLLLEHISYPRVAASCILDNGACSVSRAVIYTDNF